jgi:Zn-dependent peptidase ImmA (M78 family)
MLLLLNIEAERLELDDVPALRINNIQNDMYGVYSKEKNTITVFIPKHHPAEKIMETIIHELRHAYQHQLVREYEELDAEAVKVISASPKWKPGKVRGERVRTSLSLPVEFRLEKKGSKSSRH